MRVQNRKEFYSSHFQIRILLWERSVTEVSPQELWDVAGPVRTHCPPSCPQGPVDSSHSICLHLPRGGLRPGGKHTSPLLATWALSWKHLTSSLQTTPNGLLNDEKGVDGKALRRRCKMKTLAKVQERREQLHQDSVDNVSVRPLASYIYIRGRLLVLTSIL